MNYQTALKSPRARWKTAVRVVLSLVNSPKKTFLTHTQSFRVTFVELPSFSPKTLYEGCKLVHSSGITLEVIWIREKVCLCKYLTPDHYAYVPPQLLDGFEIWYLDKLPEPSDSLSPMEIFTRTTHTTPSGHRLEGRREIVSNKAKCTAYIGAPGESVAQRIERLIIESGDKEMLEFYRPILGPAALEETVTEKAERLFKEAEDTYAEMQLRNFKIPDLNQRPKKITAEDKLKHYEPVLAFDSVDRLFEYNKLFNAQAAERQRDFEIACETKKAEIVKWMESRITKLDTKREETSDTIRKMTIGSKIKGYKECLSYIRTRL